MVEGNLKMWMEFVSKLETLEEINNIRFATLNATNTPLNIRILLEHFLITVDNINSPGAPGSHSQQVQYDILVKTLFGTDYELYYWDPATRERLTVFFDKAAKITQDEPWNLAVWAAMI